MPNLSSLSCIVMRDNYNSVEFLDSGFCRKDALKKSQTFFGKSDGFFIQKELIFASLVAAISL